VGAQETPSMPSTLRYGSGLMDIPVSSVLPAGTLTGTYSGFWVSLDRTLAVDAAGNPVGFGPGASAFHWDGSLAYGLYDRAEAGVSVQSLGGAASGGSIWGLFGRVRLWEPIDQGLGFAVGGRYVTSPDFGNGVDYSPGRLGFPDARLLKSIMGSTNLTLYGVATAYLRGFDGGPIPKNDMTFSIGYGGGMFKQGGNVDFYAPGHANGWFFGTSLNVATSDRSILTLMAEDNGFDVNVGAQIDWSGLRVGVQYLGTNHGTPEGGHYSEYSTPKLGFLGSVAICPHATGLLCHPNMMRRVEPDTIWIPPPPPDTVIVEAAPRPEGEESEVCLSTGQMISIRVTAAGDTLVGPDFVSLDDARPALDFAGGYAAGAFWFENGDPISFEGASYGKAPQTFPMACDQVVRVGVYEGVPVFADRAAYRPLEVLFIPVRVGVWERYERGLGQEP
jgi:hypothetical protein